MDTSFIKFYLIALTHLISKKSSKSKQMLLGPAHLCHVCSVLKSNHRLVKLPTGEQECANTHLWSHHSLDQVIAALGTCSFP